MTIHYCSFCPNGYKSLLLLNYHEQKCHTSHFNTPYVQFKRKYVAYILNKNINPELLKCYKCKVLFFQEKTLFYHKKVCHLDNNSEGIIKKKCHQCCKTFKLGISLKQHLLKCHSHPSTRKEMPLITDTCQYCSEPMTYLTNHICPWTRMLDALEANMTSEYHTVKDYLRMSKDREEILNEFEQVKSAAGSIVNSIWKLPISHNQHYINLLIQSDTLREKVKDLQKTLVWKIPNPDKYFD